MQSPLSLAASRDFVLAGKAVFTLVSKATGERFTFKVTRSKDRTAPDAGGDRPVVWFVKLLAGSDNVGDYRYIGFLRDGLFVHGGKKACATTTAPSVRGFEWFTRRVLFAAEPAVDRVAIYHEGCCGRCGRRLTVPESIETGLGPECAKRAA